MSQYVPKPFRNFGGIINVEVDFSNYATKAGILKMFQTLILHVLH